MKNNLLLFIFALILGFSITLEAQSNKGTTTIIKRIIDADGNVNEETITLEGDHMDDYLQNLESEHKGALSVEVRKENEDATISITIDERANQNTTTESATKEVRVYSINDSANDESISTREITVDVEENDGNKVVTIIRDGKKKVIEVEGEDTFEINEDGHNIIVITTDDEESDSHSENITITKDGEKKIIEVNAGEGYGNKIVITNADDFQIKEEIKRKTYLGIRMENTKEKNDFVNGEITTTSGIKVLNTIPDSPAEKAGVLANDEIKAINNQPISNMENLLKYLGNKNVGDQVILQINRGGIEKNIAVILGEFSIPKMMNNEEVKNQRIRHTRKRVERDPCKPFIGVQTSNGIREGENGITINRVLENTPADRDNLQKGDVILEMDGQTVNSIQTLRSIRDAHDSGDRFKLTILRDGKRKKIRSSFDDCDSDNAIEEIIAIDSDSDMNLSQLDFSVFPNPSTGSVNVAYKGEAGPMTLNIMDISGKVLIQRTIDDFDGSYQESFDFSDQQVGTLLIQIENGGKKVVEKLVLQNLN